MRPPDAPRSGERNRRAESVAFGAGLAVTLLLLWLLLVGVQNAFQPMPAIQTPTSPRTLVVAPSPDAALATAVARIERNTAALPTLAAAYAIEQTATAGNGLATWAAARQATAAALPSGPTCLACIRGAAK